MSRPEFKSVFRDEMNCFLDEKISSGYYERSYITHLRNFDKFALLVGISSVEFTLSQSLEWMKCKPNEATRTHYSRINGIKQFLSYLSKKSYPVIVTRDVANKGTPFTPHIYSDTEIEKYFHEVDTFESAYSPKDAVQYPVLFRILYSCGTRINETLGIRKKDVDLNEGIIKLFEAKNNHERYIVLGRDLKNLMNQCAYKCFYSIKDEEYIFTNRFGGRLSGDSIYERHRLFLKGAGIAYYGGGKGPRVHDFRHHFAISSFKQMIDSGFDMYVALPILSSYLGHKSISATEDYVRLTKSIYPDLQEKMNEKVDKILRGGLYEKN